MNAIIAKLLNRAGGLADVEPVIALFLGAALLAIFLTALFQDQKLRRTRRQPGSPLDSLQKVHAPDLGGDARGAAHRNHLRPALVFAAGGKRFSRTHGRITQANYNAVQTIWGSEQVQGELNVDIYHNEEVTERIESEDPSKPALLRKKIAARLRHRQSFRRRAT